jgi:uncharacterized membrane protein
MADISMFFTLDDRGELENALLNATYKTTGEIRIRVDKKAGRDALAAARRAYVALGMKDLPYRNNVLFYISVFDRKFAVFGDDEINSRVKPEFWETVKTAGISKFSEKEFKIGLLGAIAIVSEKMAEYFPDEKMDLKENPYSITFEG